MQKPEMQRGRCRKGLLDTEAGTRQTATIKACAMRCEDVNARARPSQVRPDHGRRLGNHEPAEQLTAYNDQLLACTADLHTCTRQTNALYSASLSRHACYRRTTCTSRSGSLYNKDDIPSSPAPLAQPGNLHMIKQPTPYICFSTALLI
jgi:hypothetical protein